MENGCHALLYVVGVRHPVPRVHYVRKGAVWAGDPVVEREEEGLLLLLFAFPSVDFRSTRIRSNIGVSSVSSCGGFCHQGGLDSSRKSMMQIHRPGLAHRAIFYGSPKERDCFFIVSQITAVTTPSPPPPGGCNVTPPPRPSPSADPNSQNPFGGFQY